MSLVDCTQLECAAPVHALAERAEWQRLIAELSRWFEAEFSLYDAASGDLLWSPSAVAGADELLRSELCRAVAERGRPEIIDDSAGVLVLALPLPEAADRPLVAVATFAARHWPERAMLRLAAGFQEKSATEASTQRLQQEVEQVSDNLATTYEEISLLHTLTQHLRLSSTDEDLGRLALDWLLECMPAEGMAIAYLPTERPGHSTYKARTQTVMLAAGDCPLDSAELTHLVESLQLEAGGSPFVANVGVTSRPEWLFSSVRQIIITPLCEGANLFGWLVAVNHRADREFGSVEASLLSSVGALLGIHSGNHELYRRQAEFLANVVRALTSAIDAKDPYTCGHSDRVARISVRLAQALECEGKILSNIYMAALLHDIGKIGIDDNVLRKTGKLTDAEFAHIKQHPELGHKILADLKQLSEALPIVLHHHEAWDGKGYPHGLAGDDIPFQARIVAVADAYDAMSSDRPYRQGMPAAKVDDIFREGAGRQWDPRVVEAFFAVRDDIRAISGRLRANLSLDVEQWVMKGMKD